MNISLKNDFIFGDKICVTIAENNPEKIYKKLDCILDRSQYAEIRLDYLKNDHMIKTTIECIGKKISRCICTLRDISEGGYFVGGERRKIALLKDVYQSNPFLIDVEFNSINQNKDILKIFRSRNKLLVSWHILNNTPSYDYLKQQLNKMKKISKNIKIVTKANSKNDNIRILSLYKKSKDINLIAFAMGDMGRISRLICIYLGSPFTYASSSNTNMKLGQFKLNEYKLIFNSTT